MSFSVIGNELQLLYKSAIDKLNEILSPILGDEGLEAVEPDDYTPEAVANRIVQFSTAFFEAYKGRHPHMSETEALDLVDLVGAGSLQRLAAAARKVRGAGAGEAANTVTHVANWERQTVESVLGFHDSPGVREAVGSWSLRLADLEASMAADLAGKAEDPTMESSGLPPADDRIPVRLTRGPLDFGLPASRLEAEAAAWYGSPDFPLSGEARFELVNFIDGERSVAGIRNALSAEFGPIPTAAVARYLADLVEVGVVQWIDSD